MKCNYLLPVRPNIGPFGPRATARLLRGCRVKCLILATYLHIVGDTTTDVTFLELYVPILYLIVLPLCATHLSLFSNLEIVKFAFKSLIRDAVAWHGSTAIFGLGSLALKPRQSSMSDAARASTRRFLQPDPRMHKQVGAPPWRRPLGDAHYRAV
jgi:hypothetical protein